MNKILGSLVRHGLTTVGGAGFMASDSTVETLVTGIMTAVGAGWSLYKEYKAHRDAQQRITLPKDAA